MEASATMGEMHAASTTCALQPDRERKRTITERLETLENRRNVMGDERCPSIQDAREALDRQWDRHIGGLSGRAREITFAINDLISARLADRDRNTAMLLSQGKTADAIINVAGITAREVAQRRDATIAALEQRLNTAHEMRREYVREANARAEAAERERDAARAALAPFARAIELIECSTEHQFKDEDPAYDPFEGAPENWKLTLTIGDLRRARDAFRPTHKTQRS